MFWDMTDVFCYPTLENDKCEVRSWNNIVPSPGGSSDKILQFLFSPVSFLISTDPAMSKFVPVTPTQSRPQGFSLKKMGGAPHPIFKGKALGTSVTPTVVINMFPIDVDYSQDLLKTQIFVVGCWLLYNSDEYFSCRAPNQRAPNCPTWDQERFIAVIKE